MVSSEWSNCLADTLDRDPILLLVVPLLIVGLI